MESVKVLDFGCGSGASTIILAKNFPKAKVVGIELLQDLVEIANARVLHYQFTDKISILKAISEKSLHLSRESMILLS